MYSKQQASQVRQEFWTAFGKYMQPILSSEGGKVNWINYKTGAKNIRFCMQADKYASIAIEVTHPVEALRISSYNKFLQLCSLLSTELGEEWIWNEHSEDENGKIISSIRTQLEDVNIFNKENWPALISFFKPRIIALDAFWNNVKHEFDVW